MTTSPKATVNNAATNPKVDAYIGRSKKWPAEMAALRPILLDAGLDEEIKWGKPCYSGGGANIAIMQEMNDFLSLMFFKGALMDDPAGVLHSQGPNSRSAKRMEFTSVEQINKQRGVITEYVDEALDVEAAGLTAGPAPEPEWADALQTRLDNDPEFRAAFEALTPGRRREYNLYFSDAKQAVTRESRVEKYAPKILAGKGFRDR